VGRLFIDQSLFNIQSLLSQQETISFARENSWWGREMMKKLCEKKHGFFSFFHFSQSVDLNASVAGAKWRDK